MRVPSAPSCPSASSQHPPAPPPNMFPRCCNPSLPYSSAERMPGVAEHGGQRGELRIRHQQRAVGRGAAPGGAAQAAAGEAGGPLRTGSLPHMHHTHTHTSTCARPQAWLLPSGSGAYSTCTGWVSGGAGVPVWVEEQEGQRERCGWSDGRRLKTCALRVVRSARGNCREAERRGGRGAGDGRQKSHTGAWAWCCIGCGQELGSPRAGAWRMRAATGSRLRVPAASPGPSPCCKGGCGRAQGHVCSCRVSPRLLGRGGWASSALPAPCGSPCRGRPQRAAGQAHGTGSQGPQGGRANTPCTLHPL